MSLGSRDFVIAILMMSHFPFALQDPPLITLSLLLHSTCEAHEKGKSYLFAPSLGLWTGFIWGLSD